MEELVTMSNKEIRRLNFMQKLKNKCLTQKEIALELSLSIRQVRRLYRRYKQEGAKGLISKKRGKPSNHKLSKDIKDQVIKLILENYQDFGPTLAHEKLTEIHLLKISLSSVRNIMITNDIWKPKNKRKKRVYQLRPRRSCTGDLIQTDASPHDWFEGRGKPCNLISCIDDATGALMELEFVPSETSWAYMNVTKRYIEKYGRPLAFYTDKHGIFRVNQGSLQKDRYPFWILLRH